MSPTAEGEGPAPVAVDEARAGPLAWPRPVVQGAGGLAVVLAVLGRGDAVVLGALVAVAAGTGPGALASIGAVAAVALRWGTTSLAAVVGAQAVLGPAVAVDPLTSAAGSAMAVAGAVLGSAPGRREGWLAVAAVVPLAMSTGHGTTGVGLRAVVALASAGVAAVVSLAVPARARPAVAWVGVVLVAAGAWLCR